jgi:hypothetical protein
VSVFLHNQMKSSALPTDTPTRRYRSIIHTYTNHYEQLPTLTPTPKKGKLVFISKLTIHGLRG